MEHSLSVYTFIKNTPAFCRGVCLLFDKINH